ncbi:tumor necrosis factor ligand superfamily member 10-like [Ptychodera flava]|uniref:tumor necrosis factor ligand superfamily member 10-like n=1 Tax=Ptychodera flava TaxID=63121 RepID=UPI00396A1B23
MHDQKQDAKSSSKCVTRVAIFLIFVSFIIYSAIVAVVYSYFQNELQNLQLSIDKLRTVSKTANHQQAPTYCNCSSDLLNGVIRSNSPSDIMGNEETNHTLLMCCSANQDTVKMLIAKVYREEKGRIRNLRTERNHMTLRQVERLVESMVRRNGSQITVSSGIWNGIAVAIHVTGTSDCFEHSEPIKGLIKHRHAKGRWLKVGLWDSSNGISFTEYVPSDDYHIIVPKSGLYHVYSQAGFLDSRTTGHGHRKELNEYLHHTMLTNNGYSPYHTDLMKSVHIREGARAHVSSFHSGLFELREGDKIYMKVYLPSSEVQLDCSQESTYMGMYLVNDELSVYK